MRNSRQPDKYQLLKEGDSVYLKTLSSFLEMDIKICSVLLYELQKLLGD
jgi:hypothetical protein